MVEVMISWVFCLIFRLDERIYFGFKTRASKFPVFTSKVVEIQGSGYTFSCRTRATEVDISPPKQEKKRMIEKVQPL